MGNSQSSRVAPAGVVPSVDGGVVVNVARSEHKTGTAIATMLLEEEDVKRRLQDAARAAGPEQPQVLPAMPSAFEQQVQEWALACETEAYESQPGKRAYSFSVPMLVASQLGQTEKAEELMNDMELAINEEAKLQKISASTRAWMLGRLLTANCQLSRTAEAARVGEHLRGVLDEILARRLAKKLESLEMLGDSVEAWAWAYLLLHGDKESTDLPAFLKASRIVWNAVDAASGDVGDRMWVNTMALLAFSRQLEASRGWSSGDPSAREAVAETLGDILCFLQLDAAGFPSAAKGGADVEAVGQHQLSLSDAMRQVPVGDFRAWAISLVKLAMVQAGLDGDLAEVFREAMQSAAPGDLALGAVTWAYAMYVAEWRLVRTAEPAG